MTDSTESRTHLQQRIADLRVGDTIVVPTTQEYLTDKELTVREVKPDEPHNRAGGRHYRVYLEGTGGGPYALHRDPVTWSRRQDDDRAPELSFINEVSSPTGADERSEGEVTNLR